jgi:hypothetical protein
MKTMATPSSGSMQSAPARWGIVNPDEATPAVLHGVIAGLDPAIHLALRISWMPGSSR